MMAPGTWGDAKQHFVAAIVSPWYKRISALIATVTNTSFRFFADEDLRVALMPITCQSISSPMGLGSDSVPVDVNLFGTKTYLADSMQFQLEYVLRQGGKGAWYIMPTFRGEAPDSRHLNQFFHAEAEICGDLEAVIGLVERYITRCTQAILDEHGEALAASSGIDHLQALIGRAGRFPRVTHAQARTLLRDDARYVKRVGPGENNFAITAAGERELIKAFDGIVWLTHPPAEIVPFYQANDAEGLALAGDLLFGIGEVVGCGERHTSAEQTLDALLTHEVDVSEYDWYLRMKRVFPMHTAGFGMGLERFLLWVLKHDDIRDMHVFNRLKTTHSVP